MNIHLPVIPLIVALFASAISGCRSAMPVVPDPTGPAAAEPVCIAPVGMEVPTGPEKTMVRLDLDEDGRDDVVQWQSPDNGPAITHYDLTGDGRVDLVVTTDPPRTVVVFPGNEGACPRWVEMTPDGGHTRYLVYDGDSQPTIHFVPSLEGACGQTNARRADNSDLASSLFPLEYSFSASQAEDIRDHVQRLLEYRIEQLGVCRTSSPDWDFPQDKDRGVIVANFTITKDGTVASVTIPNSTVNSPEMEKCVLQHVSRFRFPRFGRMVKVQVPLVFR